MKKFILLTAIYSLLNIVSYAQVKVITGKNLDESIIVKDSSGMQYPYLVWKKLVKTGDYKLERVGKRVDSTYVIVKKSEDEMDARFSKMRKPQESPVLTIGQKLSSFSVTDINGNKIKLKELAGKVVVLNFWFIGCPPCRMELPDLNKLSVKYTNDPSVVFVAIALDDKYNLQQFLKTNPLGYHVIDDGQSYANLYRISLFPTNIVLNKEGKVMFHSVGYAANTPYWIKKTIEEAKQESL